MEAMEVTEALPLLERPFRLLWLSRLRLQRLPQLPRLKHGLDGGWILCRCMHASTDLFMAMSLSSSHPQQTFTFSPACMDY